MDKFLSGIHIISLVLLFWQIFKTVFFILSICFFLSFQNLMRGTEQGIRFYSYVSLVRLVRDTRLPLRVVLPEPGPAAPAPSIRRWLGALRLRPALLASRLRLILEKDGRTTESGV
jgi:hypothetical protein